jgi:hypothetical protein
MDLGPDPEKESDGMTPKIEIIPEQTPHEAKP